MERAEAAAFFHVVNTRYELGHPTLVTTNRGLPEWGEIFGDPSSPPRSSTGSCTGRRLQHQRAVLAHARAPGARNGNLEDTFEGRRKEGPLTLNRRPGTQPTANFDDRRSRKRVITERDFQ